MRRTKIAATFATLIVSTSLASAGGRPDTRSMTCAQAQSFVQQNGAVVMATGDYTFDRFVTTQAYCLLEETAKIIYAPTLDAAECPVAFYCKDVSRARPRDGSID